MHKFRWPITIFLIGVIINLVGGWMKITHQAFADSILLLGTIIEVAGVVFAIVIVLRSKR